MYKRMKKRFVYCAVLCILLSLVVNSTLAYFTAESTAHNVITTGAIDITLREETTSGEAWSDMDNIMPGDTVGKIVTVTNRDMPAYVRIKCEISVHDAEDNALDPGDMLQLDMDTKNWTYLDGWWYYNHLLDIGETTVPLFTQVSFFTTMDNEHQNCTATIDVLAQATQAANNGTDVFSAAGWPES